MPPRIKSWGTGAKALSDLARRLLSAARLADRPQQARRPLSAARARKGAVAGRARISRPGAGRRDHPGDPRPGARRARHHHRRRDAAGELFQPFRHRARRRRPRQSGHGARPERPSEPGAARRRKDPPQARGRGARPRIPESQHRPHGEDHRARALHHVAAGAERFLSERGGDGARLCRRGERRRSRICSPPAPTSCRSTSLTCRRAPRRRGSMAWTR